MSGTSPWNGKTVFVLDDSISVRSALKRTYEEMGFSVCGEASDGLEALEKLKELEPDLISIDMMMPIMHGVEFYRLLKKERDFNFLFVSALNSDYRTKESFSEEIDPMHFVAKPVNKGQLTNALNHIFGVDPNEVPAKPEVPSEEVQAAG